MTPIDWRDEYISNIVIERMVVDVIKEEIYPESIAYRIVLIPINSWTLKTL
jgi:hypothetical protein